MPSSMFSTMFLWSAASVSIFFALLTTCENTCPSDEQMCLEGCVSQELKCIHQICPYQLPYECKDQRKCYTKEQQCNKIYDCLDHSDEYGCGQSTESPYYASNSSSISESNEERSALATWVIALVITASVLVFISLLALAYVYCYLKCRLLHDQIAYDEKHKFMEEHGEMPSNGPVIAGIRPPLDGWKYVCKSVYAQEDEELNKQEQTAKRSSENGKASPGNHHAVIAEAPNHV